MKYLANFVIALCLLMPGLTFGQDITNSHIKANVPETFEQFDSIMKRDLSEYFSKMYHQPVSVEYELLRKSPTQSGVAYPKYYAWVKVWNEEQLADEGAVRVAVIERSRIDVTNFVSKQEIVINKEVLKSIFPKLLESSILAKVGK